jgi:uncharacterized protein DUF4229
VRSLSVYLLGRLAIFAVLAGLLYLVGLRSFYLLLAALLLSVPISVLLLKRPRQSLSGDIERRLDRWRADRRDLRAALRGDDSDEQD